MVDICKCTGEGCPQGQRDRCYRFTSAPDILWQSFFGTPPLSQDGTCEYFYDNGNSLPVNLTKSTRKQKARIT